MINVLFFIDSLSGGGAEKVLRTLVNNMDQQKFHITVHTVEETNADEFLIPGIRYRAINRCKTAWGRKLFSYWVRLCAELKWLYPLYIKDDYDIEVAYLECGPTKIIAGSTNKKALKLAWVHCDLIKRPELAAQAEKLKQFYCAYDKVVCVSKTAQESYISLFGHAPKTVVLYNVNDEIDILCKAGPASSSSAPIPTLVSVGRLSYEKGVDRLLEACSLLRNDGYQFELHLIGDGPERGKLEQMTKAMNLDLDVSFLGFHSNPYPCMKKADIVVCPSRYEGLSTVATEALILGKPFVTTPCSGMSELLGDSEFGLITEDSAEGIYSGIKKLLDNPDLRQHYAEAAAQRGKSFKKEITVKQTEQFFCTELEKKRNKQ